MSMITARQCKAARMLLEWLQDDLAKASGVGVGTIGKFENGEPITRQSAIDEIYKTFSRCGIQFLEDDGVKFRSDLAYVYRTTSCYEEFFNDVVRDVKEHLCDVLVFIKSQDMLIRTTGDKNLSNLDRLNLLSAITDVRCIVADVRLPSFVAPKFEIRTVPKQAIAPTPFLIFGDKLAKIYMETNSYNICVHRIPSLTAEYRNSFMFAWDGAQPIQSSRSERHARLIANA